MIKKTAIAFSLIVFLVVAVFAVMILLNEFPYKYMDLNDSGFISPREVLLTLGMSVRKTTVNGKECVEVFALKDALTVKQICPEI